MMLLYQPTPFVKPDIENVKMITQAIFFKSKARKLRQMHNMAKKRKWKDQWDDFTLGRCTHRNFTPDIFVTCKKNWKKFPWKVMWSLPLTRIFWPKYPDKTKSQQKLHRFSPTFYPTQENFTQAGLWCLWHFPFLC